MQLCNKISFLRFIFSVPFFVDYWSGDERMSFWSELSARDSWYTDQLRAKSNNFFADKRKPFFVCGLFVWTDKRIGMYSRYVIHFENIWNCFLFLQWTEKEFRSNDLAYLIREMLGKNIQFINCPQFCWSLNVSSKYTYRWNCCYKLDWQRKMDH